MARLFEQGGDVEPQLNHRVAWGLSGVSTKNSTWQTIVTWLQGTLSFLKPSNNLSDVADAATALSNIGGINSGALTPYALKTNVLELDNTVEFTPHNNYEPATKKYVDDIAYAGDQVTEDLAAPGIDLDVYCVTNTRLRMVQIQIRFNTDGFDGIRAMQMSALTAPFPNQSITMPSTTAQGSTAYVSISSSGAVSVSGFTVASNDYRAYATYFY